MNKLLVIVLLWIGSILLFCGITGVSVYKYMDKHVEQPITSQVVSKPVVRPKDINNDEMKLHLWHYDNDPFHIDWRTLNQRGSTVQVEIKGNLYQREFSQEAVLPIQVESGNWKLGLGVLIGAGVAAGAGYLAFKFMKR